MPITKDQILKAKFPFKVRYDAPRQKAITVIGSSKNDPLGVGGGLLPDMPAVYFKGGGWLLVADLMSHYNLVK